MFGRSQWDDGWTVGRAGKSGPRSVSSMYFSLKMGDIPASEL